jgi:Protein interacting with poly(A)-binding protein
MSDREGADAPTTPPAGGDASPTGGFPQPGTQPMPPPPAAGPPADPAAAYPGAVSGPSPAPSAYPAPSVGYPGAVPPGYAPPAYPSPGQPAPYAYPGQPSAPSAYGPPAYPGAPAEYPGYAGGWPPAGPPPGRGRVGLIIGIIAAVLVLVAGGLTVALLAWSANAPRAALEDWFEAAHAGDEARLRSLTCAQYAQREFDRTELLGIRWEIHEVNQIDDTLATATVSVRSPDDDSIEGVLVLNEQWAIVKEDGAWKVCGPVEYLDRT